MMARDQLNAGGRTTTTSTNPRRLPGGFTLIELMIVLLIIGVVVAIVFPALSGARNASRKAATTALMTRLGNASDQFYGDNNRLPGYFSPSEMADPQNVDRGFSMMENIMLDLATGVTQAAVANGNNEPCDEIAGPQVVQVGPTPVRTVRVNLTQIFAAVQGQKSYLQLDKKDYVRQCEAGRQVTSVMGHRALPDVVDAWGTPILAWVQDEVAPGSQVDFARETFAANNRARYYWAHNAAFLRSDRTGKLARDQAEGSLLGANESAANRNNTLTGLLGHPAYPKSDAAPPVPSVGRAGVVFHSAGNDGFFLGKEDIGGKQANATGGVVRYDPTPAAALNGPRERQRDPIDAFDDILVTAGSNK